MYVSKFGDKSYAEITLRTSGTDDVSIWNKAVSESVSFIKPHFHQEPYPDFTWTVYLNCSL